MLRADTSSGMRNRSAGALRIECVELNPLGDLAGELLYGFSIGPLFIDVSDRHCILSCQIIPRSGSTRDSRFSSTALSRKWPLCLDRKAAAHGGSLETTASDIREKEDVVQLTENRR